jgi:nitroimidazol reductase NimA-like FMN-containing flavoprotein (pyridoxamine 5'-phosphate oxidase superfamily)
MNKAQCEQFLQAAKLPLRLACIDELGFPRVISMWFDKVGDELVAITHRDAAVVRWLTVNNKIGFEASVNEPPYRGVRGTGTARIEEGVDREQMQALFERYNISNNSRLARWLVGRIDEEVLLHIKPSQLSGWDYSIRMADAKSA